MHNSTMPVPHKKLSIDKIARNDFCDFLNSMEHRDLLLEADKRARNEAGRTGLKFDDATSLTNFVDLYLSYLEQNCPIRNFDDYQHAKALFELFRAKLRKATPSSIATKYPNKWLVAGAFCPFGVFVACTLLEQESYFTTTDNGRNITYDMQGYPHRIYAKSCETQNEFRIVYDSKMMKHQTRDKKLIARRYELATLHEIGHMRLHTDHLLNSQHKDKYATAQPIHEQQAWRYAFTIMGYIAGTRARINRILNESDTEGIICGYLEPEKDLSSN